MPEFRVSEISGTQGRIGPWVPALGLTSSAGMTMRRNSIRSELALEYTLVGQPLDLGCRHAEQLAVDVVVVLAVAGRPAVDAPSRIGRAFGQLDRHLGDRPATDFGARHLSQPFECLELGIDI